jgi:hypothetical protein
MSQSEVEESLNVSDLKEKPKVNKKKSWKSNPGISKKETISKPVYEHEGYIYHFVRTNKEETLIFLRCRFNRYKGDEKRYGSAKYDIAAGKYFTTTNHNHDFDDKRSRILKFKLKVRNECRNNYMEKPRKIYKAIKKDYLDVVEDVPFTKMESTCYRQRRIHVPTIPHNEEELLQSLEDNKDIEILKYLKKIVKYSRGKKFAGLIFGRAD